MAGDGECSRRSIVHEAVVAGDILVQVHIAGEILAAGVFGQRDRVRGKLQRTAVNRGHILGSGHVQEIEGIAEQILVPVFPANPIAVDIQI